jgi:hypothetical protein
LEDASKRGLQGKKEEKFRILVLGRLLKSSEASVKGHTVPETLARTPTVQSKEGKFEAVTTYSIHFIGMGGGAHCIGLASRVAVPAMIGTS